MPRVTLPTARVLTIAGSDSGGGAGIQADLKAMLAFGVHGMSVIAAVTAQNSLGVQGVWPLPVEAVTAQFRSVVDDIGVDAVKTGMLGSRAVVEAVAELVGSGPDVPLVVDPVCVSKHGDALIDDDAVEALRTRLLPRATLVTPNLDEAARLTGAAASTPPADLARRLLAFGSQWVLVKGGHSAGEPTDHLLGAGGEAYAFTAAREDTIHTHGTGCTLASAIAARLALGDPMPEAVRVAKDYISGAIAHGFALGRGIGPTDHLWRLRPYLTGV